MFTQMNNDGDVSGLDDFIDKPLEKCSSDELTAGVARLVVILEKNPAAILVILGTNQFIPASFLLDNLIEKMTAKNLRDKVNVLFDKHLTELVNTCIYNRNDLMRCTKLMPEYTTQVIELLLGDDKKLQFMFNAENDVPDTLNKLNAAYPQFETQFTEKCQQLLTTPKLSKVF